MSRAHRCRIVAIPVGPWRAYCARCLDWACSATVIGTWPEVLDWANHHAHTAANQ